MEGIKHLQIFYSLYTLPDAQGNYIVDDILKPELIDKHFELV